MFDNFINMIRDIFELLFCSCISSCIYNKRKENKDDLEQPPLFRLFLWCRF